METRSAAARTARVNGYADRRLHWGGGAEVRRILLVLLAVAATAGAAVPPDPAYRGEIETWRAAREARLKGDGGWLQVVGLFWLKEGSNTFGTDDGNAVVLPAGSAPARAGVFEQRGGKTTVRLEPGVDATVDGKPATAGELRPDVPGPADVLKLPPRLSLHVIERGGRYGIRLKDTQSALLKEFAGLRWFPVREEHRVLARFVPYDPPKTVPVPNILGQVEELPSPGYAVFTVGGREVRLDPVLEEPGAKELFFIFRDETAGKETYPAGRFLYAPLPKDGVVALDFNKAYSPPCAFTPYATCPLPPKQNRLPVRIEAGEMHSGHH
jgi:uncharacterized protein (DUF1684 family)